MSRDVLEKIRSVSGLLSALSAAGRARITGFQEGLSARSIHEVSARVFVIFKKKRARESENAVVLNYYYYSLYFLICNHVGSLFLK